MAGSLGRVGISLVFLFVVMGSSLAFSWSTSIDRTGSACDTWVVCSFDGDDFGICNDHVYRVTAKLRQLNGSFITKTSSAENWRYTNCVGTTCDPTPSMCAQTTDASPPVISFPYSGGSPGLNVCQTTSFGPDEFSFTGLPGDGYVQCIFEARVDYGSPGSCTEYGDTAVETLGASSAFTAECCSNAQCGDMQRKRCYSNYCYTCSSQTEGENTIFYRDADNDGYDNGTWDNFCDPPSSGWIETNTVNDCNDANAGVSPGDAEVCGNSVDENCDGIAQTCAPTTEICGNGLDDDGDGLIDEDPPCTIPPGECLWNVPTVALTPSSQNAYRSDTKVYTLTVTDNNNDDDCPTNMIYDLSSSCPLGISCSLSTTSLTIPRGISNTASLSATVSSTATYQTYVLSSTASNVSTGSATAGADLIVQPVNADFCSSYPNSGTCEATSANYCDWFSNKCEGTPSPCSTWGSTNEATCESNTHKASGPGSDNGVCGWRVACEGNPTVASCNSLSQTQCSNAPEDCAWDTANCFSPSPAPSCNGISQSSCPGVPGCSWNSGTPSSCTGTPSYGCFAATNSAECGAIGTFCYWSGNTCRERSCSTHNSNSGNCASAGCTYNPPVAAYCQGTVTCSSVTPSGGSCAYGCSYDPADCYATQSESCSYYTDNGATACNNRAGCGFNTYCEGTRISCDNYATDQTTCQSNEGCGQTVSTIQSNKAGYPNDFNAALNRPGSYYVPAHCEGAKCGNNIREGPTVYNSYSEYCDGSDLAGHSCPEYACGSGNYQHGTLQCVPACNGPDTTLCWGDHVAPTASGNYYYGPNGENGWYTNDIPFGFSCDSTPDSQCHGTLGSHACVVYWCQGAGCNPLSGTQAWSGSTSGEGTMIIRYQARDTNGLTSPIYELAEPGTNNYPKVDKTPPTLTDLYLDADEAFGPPYKNVTDQRVTTSLQTKSVDPQNSGVDVISGLNTTSGFVHIYATDPSNVEFASPVYLDLQKPTSPVTYHGNWIIPSSAPNDAYYFKFRMKDLAGNWRETYALNNFLWVGEQTVRMRRANLTAPSPVVVPIDSAATVTFTVENMMDSENEIVVNVINPTETMLPMVNWIRVLETSPEERFSTRFTLDKFSRRDVSVSVRPTAMSQALPYNLPLELKATVVDTELNGKASVALQIVAREGKGFFSQTPESSNVIAVVVLFALGALLLLR